MAKLDKQISDLVDNAIHLSNADIANSEPIELIVNQFIQKVKDNLERFGHNTSKTLQSSIIGLPTKQISSGVWRVSVEAESYWKDVDEGTKPQGYSKEARNKLQAKIYYWILEKPQLMSIAKNNNIRRSLSYAIATNILKKGTIQRFGYKGSKFLTSELDTFKINMVKAIEETILKK